MANAATEVALPGAYYPEAYYLERRADGGYTLWDRDSSWCEDFDTWQQARERVNLIDAEIDAIGHSQEPE